ncbi:MAG: MATE family efflux transporter [Eubacteriales bacterium]|nr:MATE family efflux transporter [Eubacteriales bacterium]
MKKSGDVDREKSIRLTEGKPGRQIFYFALPLMLGNMFQQFYTFADTVIVGKRLGMAALAALGATEWLTFLMFSAVQGMTGGFGVLIARYFGGQDFGKMQRAMRNGGILCIALAFLFLVAGELSVEASLQLIGTPEEAREMAKCYLRWLYAGIPVTFAYHMGSAVLRAWGDSRTPFLAIAISGAGNVALDFCFVVIWNWGIAGAAFATVLSQLLSAGLCLNAVVRRQKETRERYAERRDCDAPETVCGQTENVCGGAMWGRMDVSMAKEQLLLGIPLALQGVITALGGLVVQSVVNSFGVIFVAGYTAANKLYGLLEMAASSYGHAVVNFVSQNLGAKRFDRIRRGMGSAAILGCLTALLMSAIMLFAGKFILLCFLSGEQEMVEKSLEIGRQFLTVLSVFFPFLYLLYILRAGIQGLGNGVIPMASSAVQLAMRIACALLLTRRTGYAGLFWGEVFAWLGADALLLICLLKNRAFGGRFFIKT